MVDGFYYGRASGMAPRARLFFIYKWISHFFSSIFTNFLNKNIIYTDSTEYEAMNCIFIFLDRIAVYKAIYSTAGVLSDVLAAIDQVINNFGALSSEFLL